MAIIQNPKDVASGGSNWLEGFQMLYALSEMAHKSYTRKLGKEKYISDAINTAYDTFKSNPNDLGALDATIDKIGQIGQNYSAAADSLVFQNFAQKMDTLKTERLELINVNSRLDKFFSGNYDLQNFIGIKNDPGWHPMTSKKPSNTTIELENAMEELRRDSSDMDKMGRLSKTDSGLYIKKLEELEKAKGFVGYDGMLQWKDIQHMKAGPNLTSVFGQWQSSEASYVRAIDDKEATKKRIEDRVDHPPTSGSIPPYEEWEVLKLNELEVDLTHLREQRDEVRKNLSAYGWDYAMIGPSNLADFGIPDGSGGSRVNPGDGDDSDNTFGHSLVFNDKKDPPVYQYRISDGESPPNIKDISEKEYKWLRETQGTDIWQGGKDYSSLDVPDDWEPKGKKKGGSAKKKLRDGTIGVEAQNRKTGEREVAVRWNGKNFENAEGDTVNVYKSTSGFQDLKDIYNEDQAKLKADEEERTKLEPSVKKNEKLTKEIKSILRFKVNVRKDLTPKQRLDMFRSIKEGTLHAIPDSVLDELSEEWNNYISTNAVSGAGI